MKNYLSLINNFCIEKIQVFFLCSLNIHIFNKIIITNYINLLNIIFKYTHFHENYQKIHKK